MKYHEKIIELATETLDAEGVNPNEKKINAIKVVREELGLSLHEAKNLVEHVSGLYPSHESFQTQLRVALYAARGLVPSLEEVLKTFKNNNPDAGSGKDFKLYSNLQLLEDELLRAREIVRGVNTLIEPRQKTEHLTSDERFPA